MTNTPRTDAIALRGTELKSLAFELVDLARRLEREVTLLRTALQAASDHLDYCGYGDKWERECAQESKLPENIARVLEETTS